MKQLKVVLIGAGNRGTTYTDYMANTPDKFKVVAVAEPIESRRQHIKELHNIPDDMCFDDYKPLFELGKIADIVIIATMDRDHFEPSMKAIELGYDLLLEKPITPTPEECVALTDAAVKNNVKVVICTVLRYTYMFSKLKEIIDSGKIGKVMSVNHEEGVGFVHHSHSFVRGRWGNSERSSVMLLQKSCHDIDILQWLIGKRCRQVQSFGHLSYFNRDNAPEGSPEYCIEGCPEYDTCPYNAVKLYFDDKGYWYRRAITNLYFPTDDDVIKTITTEQPGKCIFKCDNDVVDHQTVNMLFEDNITVTFTMSAFTAEGRYIDIMGTKGHVRAVLGDDSPIKIYNSLTKEYEEIACSGSNSITGGHGGGDSGIVETLYDYMIGEYTGCSIPTIEESCYSHLVTFAAEQARLDNKIIDVEEYIKNIKAI